MSAEDTETGLNQYRCSACQKIFDKGWSDEDAMKEKDIDFNSVPIEDCFLVCDDCYNLMGLKKTHDVV